MKRSIFSVLFSLAILTGSQAYAENIVLNAYGTSAVPATESSLFLGQRNNGSDFCHLRFEIPKLHAIANDTQIEIETSSADWFTDDVNNSDFASIWNANVSGGASPLPKNITNTEQFIAFAKSSLSGGVRLGEVKLAVKRQKVLMVATTRPSNQKYLFECRSNNSINFATIVDILKHSPNFLMDERL